MRFVVFFIIMLITIFIFDYAFNQMLNKWAVVLMSVLSTVIFYFFINKIENRRLNQ